MTKNRIYIGYDVREHRAYEVCKFSIELHSKNVEIFPLVKSQLPMYNRPNDKLSSTEFTFTRFLVPYLNDYNGVALFVDCDFLFTDDIQKLFDEFDSNYAVQVVKHNYVPENLTKMDNQVQTIYERKNWSSCILYNCEKCSTLTPEIVNTESGLYLHQFRWLDDSLIGSLDEKFNYLVDVNKKHDVTPIGIHYTNGGPWFKEYKNCTYNGIWLHYERMMNENRH